MGAALFRKEVRVFRAGLDAAGGSCMWCSVCDMLCGVVYVVCVWGGGVPISCLVLCAVYGVFIECLVYLVLLVLLVLPALLVFCEIAGCADVADVQVSNGFVGFGNSV